jgi:hypothetical protein
MAPKKEPTTGRDSGTGKFVTDKYVKAHPKTTETEHNKKPKGK